MPENPFEKMLEQFYQLLELIEETKTKKVADEFPPDIEESLDALEKGVELFRKINETAISEAGITSEDLKKMIISPAKAKTREVVILERAKKLRQIVQEIEQRHAVEYQIAKRKEKVYGKKQDAKSMAKARKKKFKRLGGDDWVPL